MFKESTLKSDIILKVVLLDIYLYSNLNYKSYIKNTIKVL